jgi:hypothetical protein
MSAFDQGRGQAVSRAAGQAKLFGQSGQSDRAGFGYHIQQIQAPEQGLAAARALGRRVIVRRHRFRSP